MHKVYFAEPLPTLILQGTKTSTWRIDEPIKRISETSNITIGEQMIFYNDFSEKFATATITSIRKTTFGELTEEDKKGHEKFNSDEEMYETYSRYYKTQVTKGTRIKIIRFTLNKSTDNNK